MPDHIFLIKYGFFAAGTLIFSFLINRVFLHFIKSLGTKTAEGAVRWNPHTKPSIGGLSFYIIFLLSLALYPMVFDEGSNAFNMQLTGIIMACSLGFLMGLTDDAYHTNPALKSSTQIICGVILVFTGTQIDISPFDLINKGFTLVWVMGIMNSINMLDNMDGITGLVSLTIAAGLLIDFVVTNQINHIYFFLLTGLVTSLLGFLYFNWNPSKMFMGDSGSQFLGIILASVSIMFMWNVSHPISGAPQTTRQFLLPLLAFIVPIADTTTVVINRIAKGQSPFVGGRDHTTHNMARVGLSDRNVALVIGLICVISNAIMIVINQNASDWTYQHALWPAIYCLVVVLGLFAVTRWRLK